MDRTKRKGLVWYPFTLPNYGLKNENEEKNNKQTKTQDLKYVNVRIDNNISTKMKLFHKLGVIIEELDRVISEENLEKLKHKELLFNFSRLFFYHVGEGWNSLLVNNLLDMIMNYEKTVGSLYKNYATNENIPKFFELVHSLYLRIKTTKVITEPEFQKKKNELQKSKYLEIKNSIFKEFEDIIDTFKSIQSDEEIGENAKKNLVHLETFNEQKDNEKVWNEQKLSMLWKKILEYKMDGEYDNSNGYTPQEDSSNFEKFIIDLSQISRINITEPSNEITNETLLETKRHSRLAKKLKKELSRIREGFKTAAKDDKKMGDPNKNSSYNLIGDFIGLFGDENIWEDKLLIQLWLKIKKFRNSEFYKKKKPYVYLEDNSVILDFIGKLEILIKNHVGEKILPRKILNELFAISNTVVKLMEHPSYNKMKDPWGEKTEEQPKVNINTGFKYNIAYITLLTFQNNFDNAEIWHDKLLSKLETKIKKLEKEKYITIGKIIGDFPQYDFTENHYNTFINLFFNVVNFINKESPVVKQKLSGSKRKKKVSNGGKQSDLKKIKKYLRKLQIKGNGKKKKKKTKFNELIKAIKLLSQL